jgi:hypothetical protein
LVPEVAVLHRCCGSADAPYAAGLGKEEDGGSVFMDVKAAFNIVTNEHLGRRTEEMDQEPDLSRRTQNIMTERQVKLVLDGEMGQANPVDTGIPQGSPATPILFISYRSGIFNEVDGGSSYQGFVLRGRHRLLGGRRGRPRGGR